MAAAWRQHGGGGNMAAKWRNEKWRGIEMAMAKQCNEIIMKRQQWRKMKRGARAARENGEKRRGESGSKGSETAASGMAAAAS
jgi:hypothetical protein